MADDDISFQYANECDLEIHCSPFGLSGLYIKIKGTNIIGIGSTMGLITGLSQGLIHYNDSQDLINQKYKLYVVVEEDNLRIDFIRIFNRTATDKKVDPAKSGTVASTSPSPSGESKAGGQAANPSTTRNPSATDTTSPHSDKIPDQLAQFDHDDIPTLVFTGKCPDGRPDKIDPFIGIFSFEREE